VLAAAVMKATQNFVEQGEDIANENPDVQEDMLAAVDEVRKTGDHWFPFFLTNNTMFYS